MATVGEHYSSHLAKHCCWLFGDFDAKVERERQFFVSNGLSPRASAVAIDLGAGPGFQSIALADLGYRVTAVDLCPDRGGPSRRRPSPPDRGGAVRLAELDARAGARRIETICSFHRAPHRFIRTSTRLLQVASTFPEPTGRPSRRAFA